MPIDSTPPIHALHPDQRYALLAAHALDHAMIITDADGTIVEWSAGAERLLGWSAAEALGRPAAMIFTEADRAAGAPQEELGTALALGRASDVRWHLRKDGGTVFCDGIVNRLDDPASGAVLGFGKVVREAQSHGVERGVVDARRSREDAQTARAETVREQDRRIEVEASHERLRKIEEQLRLAADAARLGIWTWEARRDCGTWENEQVYRIFGVAADTPVADGARLMAEFLHPDDAGAFRQAMEDTLRDGTRFHFSGRIHYARGPQLRWIEVTGALAPPTSGAGKVVIGTVLDITERKEAERTHEEARVRLAATLTAGEVGTWIWDIRDDRIVGDRNLARLFGVSEDVVAGAPLAAFTAVIHPDDIEQVGRRIRRALATGEPYTATYRILHPQAGQRWLSARGGIENDEQGRPALLAGVILDITQQKETQDALNLAEERYRTLITSMDEAFAIIQVITDEDGRPVDYRFEQVNRAIEEQSGLVDAAGKTIREMVPDIEQRWIDIYGRVALNREPVRFTEHSAAMGYWWDVYAAPIGAPHEQRIAILFTDITARRAAEEKLRQTAADLSETNRRKTEFLATLAHELRNPLAPMRTGLDLMRLNARDAGGGGGGSGARVLEMMDRQLRQMVHLIDDLMDISRINSGKIVLKREPVDLRDVIANAVESALPAIEMAHHTMRVQVADQAMALDADPTRLAQILSNLLTNAIKYTPNGGAIALSAWVAGDAVVVAVSDSGIGIPPDEQARVFDMFSQVSRNMGRAQGGLGIGLSLVRSLVEMHGGSIAVASPGTGQGSTFSVTLPLLATAQAPAATAAHDEAGAPGQGLLVVVADDNVDAAEMLGALLEAAGHRTAIVHDGLAAVRAIAERAPDVAILDIGMPGLSGYEVAQQVRAGAGGRDTVLIALTGWGGELDRSRSDQAGFDAHLTKPAGLAELDGLMKSIVASRAAARR